MVTGEGSRTTAVNGWVRRAALMATLLTAALAAPVDAQAGKAAFDAGMRLMRENKPAQAETQFERAIAQDGRNGLYHLWLGNAIGSQVSDASTVRQPFMARRIKAEFERAVELDPALLDARDGLVGFYLGGGEIILRGGNAVAGQCQPRFDAAGGAA